MKKEVRSAFAVLLFLVTIYVKPAIQTVQCVIQIAFTDLSRRNVANSASSFMSFTNNN